MSVREFWCLSQERQFDKHRVDILLKNYVDSSIFSKSANDSIPSIPFYCIMRLTLKI